MLAIRVEIGGEEFKRGALTRGAMAILAPDNMRGAAFDLYFGRSNTFEVNIWPGGAVTVGADFGHGLYPAVGNMQWVRVEPNPQRTDFEAPQNAGGQDSVPDLLDHFVRTSTFVFDAQRYNIGRRPADGLTRLEPNASNLPNMLLQLNRDYRRTETFQSLVSEVLPFVRRVVVSNQGQDIEISIQSDPSFRGDLAIPLDQCGTGVAQVLAILYVLVAYPSAQILVDEPNSFLHPGATKRLLQVMKRFTSHQFILTTHAADVIAVAQPERLLLFRWQPTLGATTIEASDGSDIDHLRTSLSELGATVSDVFGYDMVVFVEGPTEAACFPLLVPPDFKLAANFVSMREASALTREKPEALFDIYSRGVEGSALMPPTTRFSFDTEGRTAREIEDLTRAAKGSARFLPKPMFESYFLNPPALVAFLGGLENGAAVTEEAIQKWIDEHSAEFPVLDKNKKPTGDIDAASLIGKLVSDFTGARWEYHKVEHGEFITRWLLTNSPGQLGELVRYVADLVRIAPPSN